MSFIRKEPVLTAAGVLAAVSMLFVPPDAVYVRYIDFKTLSCLLCLMISLKGIECEGLLTALSIKLSSRIKSLRALGFVLVFLCFFVSMLMTNDVALIAIVPITLAVLFMCRLERYSAFIIVMQTLAANIGSSLTPIGNPQNLFLFVRYDFHPVRFIMTMLPFVLFGGALLTVFCCLLPRLTLSREPADAPVVRKKAVVVYGAMFLLAVAAVFGLIPYQAAVIIIAASALWMDRRTLFPHRFNGAPFAAPSDNQPPQRKTKHFVGGVIAKVDYSLLLTFAAIFIFVGNLSRIDCINSFISGWAQRDATLTAVISSQFISNVPAAVMLSGFTDNAAGLLMGVNVGGMGTLIASMASVISYKLYMAVFPHGARHYLVLFAALNTLSLGLSILLIQFFDG